MSLNNYFEDGPMKINNVIRSSKSKEADKHFNFSHFYNKFKQTTFTTVRGKTYFPKVKVGDIVFIEFNGALLMKCKVMKKELSIIRDLSLEFMKNDGEYSDGVVKNKIKNHQDFIDLINSFRRFNKANIDSEISIFHFRIVPLGVN